MKRPADKRPASNNRLSVLVIFGASSLYGMERGVIEIFDLLRPEIEPHFLISRTPQRLGLPLFDEIERRKLTYSFFSDYKGWERVGKPRSLSQGWKMLWGMCRGNIDALREIRRHEVLYIPNLMAALYAIAAIFYSRLTGRRVAYHFHDLRTEGQAILSMVSLFITDFVHNTKLGHDHVLSLNRRLRNKRNYIIPYPVNVGIKALQKHLVSAGSNGKRNVLFMGRVSLEKGVDILLDAFEALAKSHEDLVLNIVGGCEDPILRHRLENGTAGNACEVKWWGYQSEVGPFLSKADVYVQPTPPSRCHESFGIGLVEAMSWGVPSVCFRSGSFQEVIVHEKTGLICDDETSDALAAALDRFLSDARFRDECGGRAQQRYQNHYSLPLVKKKWLETLLASQ